MSLADGVKILADIRDKGVKVVRNVYIICTNTCRVIYNPEFTYNYTPDGLLSEVIMTGVDENGVIRSYRKTYTYDPDGNLIHVSGWAEI